MPAKTKKLTPIEQALFDYIAEGDKYGCPPDQMANFFKAGVILQPKQLQFAAYARQADNLGFANDIMLGGGRGAAKTHAVLAQIFCDDCQRVPGLKFLIL